VRLQPVSVVIPSYNSNNTIRRCLDSVLAQSHKPSEIIIVEDGSGQPIESIVNEYKKKMPNIRYLALQKNSGSPAQPRNVGLRLAQSGVVAFLDADDFWLSQHLERSLSLLSDDPQSLVCGNAILSSQISIRRLLIKNRPNKFSRRSLLMSNFVVTSSVLGHKALFVDAGGFCECQNTFEDYALWLKLPRIDKIQWNDEVTVVYDDSPNQSMSDTHKSQLTTYLRTLLCSVSTKSPGVTIRLASGFILYSLPISYRLFLAAMRDLQGVLIHRRASCD
jgi:glycosyltransferase involved in cell wall biosynthesis